MKNIGRCPFCGDELFVKEFKCKGCGTEIAGEFKRDKFSNLSSEILEFAEIFILNEGNMTGVEETLGYSYPKIKNMLRELIKALGYEYKERKGEQARLIMEKQVHLTGEILDMLEKGEINADKAAELLNKIK